MCKLSDLRKKDGRLWFVCLRYVSAASLKFHAAPSTVTKERLKLRIRYVKEPIRIRSVNYLRLDSQQKTEYFFIIKSQTQLQFSQLWIGNASRWRTRP